MSPLLVPFPRPPFGFHCPYSPTMSQLLGEGLFRLKGSLGWEAPLVVWKPLGIYEGYGPQDGSRSLREKDALIFSEADLPFPWAPLSLTKVM